MTLCSLVKLVVIDAAERGFQPHFQGIHMQFENRTSLITNSSSILVTRYAHILSSPSAYFQPASLLGLTHAPAQELLK
jgi:hypothetical protein